MITTIIIDRESQPEKKVKATLPLKVDYEHEKLIIMAKAAEHMGAFYDKVAYLFLRNNLTYITFRSTSATAIHGKAPLVVEKYRKVLAIGLMKAILEKVFGNMPTKKNFKILNVHSLPTTLEIDGTTVPNCYQILI
jgi:hypothetical protein